MPVIPTQNEGYGFFGTMACIGQDSPHAWACALPLVMAATGCPDWAARDFLDSRHGRHFADEVAGHIGRGLALEPAIIDQTPCTTYVEPFVGMGGIFLRRTARTHGIPAGLPYLTGWVGYYEMSGEVAD
jgi:hypothetical protein